MNTYSLDYIDDLYVRYIQDPTSVSTQWRKYFEEFSLASQAANARPSNTEGFDSESHSDPDAEMDDELPDSLWLARMQERVDLLVREYRVRGHLMARLDPLDPLVQQRIGPPELDPVSHGLSESDLNRPFTDPTSEHASGKTLADILQKLRNTYCRSIGAQFTHIDDRHIRDWLLSSLRVFEDRFLRFRRNR